MILIWQLGFSSFLLFQQYSEACWLYSDCVRLDLVAPHPTENSNKAPRPAVPAMWVGNYMLKQSFNTNTWSYSTTTHEAQGAIHPSIILVNGFWTRVFFTLFLSWIESRRQGWRGGWKCTPKKQQLERRGCRPSDLIWFNLIWFNLKRHGCGPSDAGICSQQDYPQLQFDILY